MFLFTAMDEGSTVVVLMAFSGLFLVPNSLGGHKECEELIIDVLQSLILKNSLQNVCS